MRENVLEGLGTLVTGAMLVALGILVALCFVLILRSGAMGAVSFRRRRKSREQKENDDRRRERVRSFFW